MTFNAPAWAAPWTALAPTPPTPITMTVSPALTCPVWTAAPQPVPTQQPSRQAAVKSVSAGTLTAECTEMVLYSLKADTPAI